MEAVIYSKILRLHSSDLDCEMKYVHGPITLNLSDIPENCLEILYIMRYGDWPVFWRYYSRYFILLLSLKVWLDLQEIESWSLRLIGREAGVWIITTTLLEAEIETAKCKVKDIVNLQSLWIFLIIYFKLDLTSTCKLYINFPIEKLSE